MGAACATHDSLDDRERLKEGGFELDAFISGAEDEARRQRREALRGVSGQDLLCPISRVLLTEPAVAPCKHRFNRKSILNWLTRASVCPVCRSPLLGEWLKPDRELARLAAMYAEENPDADVGDAREDTVKISECFETAPRLAVTSEQHAAIERALTEFSMAHGPRSQPASPDAEEGEGEGLGDESGPPPPPAPPAAAGPAGPLLHPNPEEDLRLRLTRAVGSQIADAYLDSLRRQIEYEMRLATLSDLRPVPTDAAGFYEVPDLPPGDPEREAFLRSADYRNQLFFAEEGFGLRGLAHAAPARCFRVRQHTVVVFGPDFPLRLGPLPGDETGLWDAAFIGPHRATTFDRVPQFSVWVTGPALPPALARLPTGEGERGEEEGAGPPDALPSTVCMFVRDAGEALNPMRVFRRLPSGAYARLTVDLAGRRLD